jgi:hypothetical protein
MISRPPPDEGLGTPPISVRMISRPPPDEWARGEGRRPVPRDVPRLRAAKFTSRAGVGSRRAYSAGTPDLGEDDFEVLPTGGLRRGPRQLVWRAFRVATVADQLQRISCASRRSAGRTAASREGPLSRSHAPLRFLGPSRRRRGAGVRESFGSVDRWRRVYARWEAAA